ncbi:multidrug ABC transporter ATP-binding protein [Arthrobacter sp. TPD3018]|uniref:ABC transporter ATP-binding protein n=1 Tax=Bacteria TaxID=2 RepID=UPI000D506329|nr:MULTISPECIES: ABC transporter ATP-binding protein [Bacteria]PVE59836.1 multidrug ABC transporter ATP-binding protein [Sphingomonas sp. TPD3009]PVE61354.1 multidrug ABC transporter ATP-binding protein [Arthrobacter sp. TPD3018]PVE85728.1 multidrug ABC transporter ATP-binding protein [Sphingomonas melonis]
MSRDLADVARLTRVSKRLGGRNVLAGLDLGIRAGEVTALLGPNGAGKTTSVSLLTGRIAQDAGTATVFGLDPRRPAARRRLGVMLQSAGLPDVLTIAEVLTLQSGYYPDPRPLTETLALAGLDDLADRRCAALSGGQARRVHYALAICGRPDLLVLDEPTAAMDRASARVLWGTVRDVADHGTAVLLTSHDLAEADALADRIVVMDAGTIVADDTPAALRARAGGSVIRCRSQLTPDRVASAPAVRDAGMDGADLRIVSADAAATVRALLDTDITLTDLRVADATLEDAIAALLSTQPERIAA